MIQSHDDLPPYEPFAEDHAEDDDDDGEYEDEGGEEEEGYEEGGGEEGDEEVRQLRRYCLGPRLQLIVGSQPKLSISCSRMGLPPHKKQS